MRSRFLFRHTFTYPAAAAILALRRGRLHSPADSLVERSRFLFRHIFVVSALLVSHLAAAATPALRCAQLCFLAGSLGIGSSFLLRGAVIVSALFISCPIIVPCFSLVVLSFRLQRWSVSKYLLMIVSEFRTRRLTFPFYRS